jgi:phosphoesterase RecJ-like protein
MPYKSDSKEIIFLKELLTNSNNIVLTTHHNPDGDAIGSLLGLYFAFKNSGYKAIMVSPNGFPDFLSWLPGISYVNKYSEKKSEVKTILLNADLIICLDFNGFKRTEEMGEFLAQSEAKKILIDHHPDPESPFDLMISDTGVSSTAELVYDVIEAAFGTVAIDLNSATPLFVGIMTDTGSFSYACSKNRAFQVAGELVSKGVNVEKIQGLVYNNFSAERMKLMGFSLNEKMKVFPEHKAAYISLTKEDLKKFNHRIGDTEGFVNLPLTIKRIIFSALFVEYDTFVKVSLRSRGDFPVNIFCSKHFNGGGHMNAAGGKSFTTLKETENIFEKLLHQYSQDLNTSNE